MEVLQLTPLDVLKPEFNSRIQSSFIGSVLVLVVRIFTDMSISTSLSETAPRL